MVKWIGRHSAAITRAGDTLYFIQSANPKWSDTEHCADLHLKCTKLDANAPIVDLGRLVDPAGRTPNLVDCLAADAKGNVFTIGTWRIKPEEIGTDVSSYSHDAGSGDNKPFGQYYDMWRGLFFGTISAQMIHSAAAPATQPAAAASMPATKSVEVSTPGKACDLAERRLGVTRRAECPSFGRAGISVMSAPGCAVNPKSARLPRAGWTAASSPFPINGLTVSCPRLDNRPAAADHV
jgi:hypothetical protein